MKIHELKLDFKYFNDVQMGNKTFEIRKNDRDFQVDDILALTAFDKEKGKYLKQVPVGSWGGITYERVNQQEATTIFYDVAYITDYEQKDGYVVMGIVPSRKIRQ